MRTPRGGTKLAVRLSVAVMHGSLRASRGCPLESVALGIQRLRARVGDRDFYLLPFHRATAIRLRASRATVVAAVVNASTTSMDPQGQSLFVESVGKFARRYFEVFSASFDVPFFKKKMNTR